jgi:hypothetical protein
MREAGIVKIKTEGARMQKNDEERIEDHIAMARQYATEIAAFEGARQGMGAGITLHDACLLATAHASLALMEIKLGEDRFRD